MVEPIVATELILLLVKRLTDYDFTHYSLPVLQRRIDAFLKNNNIMGYPALLTRLLEGDVALLQMLIQSLTITYSVFFRDTKYFERLHYSVLPKLSIHANIKVWSLGCSTGEEIYSLACLFKINNLLERTRFLGTDINENALASARTGAFDIERLDELQTQFKAIGFDSSCSLIDSISVVDDKFSFNESITKRCQFSKHNVVKGGSLGRMHIVSCRNLLIYLSRDEQIRIVKDLLIPSVEPGGYLLLGNAENIQLELDMANIKKLSSGINIFQVIE
jgi:chemotaxis protein methyltransferase CheR